MTLSRRVLDSYAIRAGLALAVLAAAALLWNPHRADDGPARGALAGTAPDYDQQTSLLVSSFNMLGYGHTTGNQRQKYADGITRTKYAVRLLNHYRPSIVGVQEMQAPQYTELKALTGTTWGAFPGNQLSKAAMQNSILWRRDTWSVVEAHTMKIYYFHGNLLPMPYVLLRNKRTGRQVWIYNSHNPADAHGDAQKWRNKDVRLEIGLVQRLRSAYPNTPILDTGDKNDRAAYMCPMAMQGGVGVAAGGGELGGSCVTPAQMRADWIVGTNGVQFTRFRSVRTPLVAKTTDHYLQLANATLPSSDVAASGITHVVVLDAEGLRGGAVTADLMPQLTALRTAGSSTRNARSDPHTISRTAALTGILTGRPSSLSVGGTGLTSATDGSLTLGQVAGGYVHSVFDTAHDHGMATALYATSPGMGQISMSYDAGNGAPDVSGVSSGTDKIDTRLVGSGETATFQAARSSLAGADPAELTVLQLASPQVAGDASGYRTEAYRTAVQRLDTRIGRMMSTIKASPVLAGHTLVIVTAGEAGTRMRSPLKRVATYRVPLVVWGPGVAADTNLYDLNPQYADPGARRVASTAAVQPVRTALVANLVTKYLGLPAVTGSVVDPAQATTVLAGP